MTELNNVHLMHADDTPHTNAYICKALGSTTKELTIEEFVAITAYPINPIMFSHFWQVILNGRSAHVGRPLLEYFGYEGDICGTHVGTTPLEYFGYEDDNWSDYLVAKKIECYNLNI